MPMTMNLNPQEISPAAGWRSVGLVRHDASARAALAARLDTMHGWLLVFSCGSTQEALAQLERSAPSVLLVDLGLPDGGALEVLRQAGRYWPACVAIAICDDDAAVHRLQLPAFQGDDQPDTRPVQRRRYRRMGAEVQAESRPS